MDTQTLPRPLVLENDVDESGVHPMPKAEAPTATANADANANADAITKKPGRAKYVFAGLLALAVTAGGSVYAHGLGKETTDDAQVEGRIFNVASRINGRVATVKVTDNQHVEAGDVLVVLEDEQPKAKVAIAKADAAAAKAQLASAKAQLALTEKNVDASVKQAEGAMAQAKGTLASSGASVAQAKGDVAGAESRLALARTELARVEALVAKGAATNSELDARTSAFDQAQAALDAAKARLTVALAGTSTSAGGVAVAKGRLDAAQTGPQQLALAEAAVALAQAKVDQTEANEKLAELDLTWTTVVAPTHGLVSRRNVEPGQMVDPSRPLLAIVPEDDVWIVANFKEDQLAEMKIGQKVVVELDAYGGKKLDAHVDSFSGATGARFALLPPDNATGNFTKVVQRVPVLVRLEKLPEFPVRPGMSAFVTVVTK